MPTSIDRHPVRRCFVSHPFAGDPERSAKRVATIARSLALDGILPLAPHLYLPAFLSESTEREVAVKLCLALVAVCDEVRVYGELTEGVRREIAEARRLGIPVLDGETGEVMADNGEPPR